MPPRARKSDPVFDGDCAEPIRSSHWRRTSNAYRRGSELVFGATDFRSSSELSSEMPIFRRTLFSVRSTFAKRISHLPWLTDDLKWSMVDRTSHCITSNVPIRPCAACVLVVVGDKRMLSRFVICK